MTEDTQELPKACCMNIAKDGSFQACEKPAAYWYNTMKTLSMNRRNFLGGLAVGLFLPYEPLRIYSMPSRNYLESLNLSKIMSFNGIILGQNIDLQTHEAIKWKAYERNAFLNFIIKSQKKKNTVGYYQKLDNGPDSHNPIWGDGCCSFCLGIDSEFTSTANDACLVAWSKTERKASYYPSY